MVERDGDWRESGERVCENFAGASSEVVIVTVTK